MELEPGSPIIRMAVRCDRRAPARIRRALEEARAVIPVLDDACLVATELVNNAVLHSGCDADDIICVSAGLEGDYLVISVHDPGASEGLPPVDREDDRRARDLGLRIVQSTAHRGARGGGAHRVWAELALPAV
jgi:anti-sigma regulatory factor (Ser/Thr protein kinase)